MVLLILCLMGKYHDPLMKTDGHFEKWQQASGICSVILNSANMLATASDSFGISSEGAGAS